ncbi:MAG: Rieske 2Fe-2S domain-containing protein [Nanoarchaeota archaeon]
MKKVNHIIWIVILLTLFIIAVEFIELVRNNVFYFSMALLAALIFIFWKKQSRPDVYLLSFIFIGFLISRLLFRSLEQSTLILRVSSILAFFLLNIVLLIGPWSRFSDRILNAYYYRRHLGVSVLFLGWLHSAIILPKYFGLSIKNALSFEFTFYGFTAFFIMLWMGITSWDYLQKRFRPLWWKILHGALLLIYMTQSYLFYTILKVSNSPLLNYHLAAIIIFIVFWIVVAPYSIIRKIMKTYVFGWKQLHVLVYIAYFSLILHVYYSDILKGLLLNFVFYGVVFFVILSHIAGWMKKLIEDNKINNKIKNINKTIMEGNDTYIGVAYKEDIQEGAGKKVYVKNKPIALFNHKGNFIAMSDICVHQKGPLHKGKIIYDSVECPWHHWQYSVKDGKAPSGFKDCVPYYKTKIKDNIVYVSID